MIVYFTHSQLLSAPLLILSLLCPLSSIAGDKAHEHGVGTLTIAVEGNDVEIELTVPGSDVVGFEHVPSSDIERQAVTSGAKSLHDVDGIINLASEAKCQSENVRVTSDLMEDKKGDHKEVHGEFVARYHFHCDNPKQLTSATLGFFKAFPSAHELEAKWITLIIT